MKITSAILLFSYLFLVAVTSFHHHKVSVNHNPEITISNESEIVNVNFHDASKCTIFHFTNYYSLGKNSFSFDEQLSTLITKLESAKFHLTSKSYLVSQLRAPPAYNS